MRSIHKFIWISIICYIISILIDIAAITLGIIQIDSCNNKDNLTALNVSQYLIGGGCVNIAFSLILIGFVSFTSRNRTVNMSSDYAQHYDLTYYPMTYPVLLIIMFNIGWSIVVGAIILFNGNIDCIANGSIRACFGKWFWCISILRVIRDCIVLPVSYSFIYEQ